MAAGAIIGGAGLGLIGASKSSSAAKSAAATQAGAADAATQAQLAMYEQTRADQAPWRMAGQYGLNALVGTPKTTTGGEPIYSTPTPYTSTGNMLAQPGQGYWTWETQQNWETGQMELKHVFVDASQVGAPGMPPPLGGTVSQPTITGYTPTTETPATEGLLAKGPGEFIPEQEPGYKFGYEEFIEKPSLRLASATGKLGSGATLKALSRYASDYASTKYDNFLDRWYKSLDPHFRLAGMGSNVAISGGQQAGQTGAGVAQTTLAGGQAQAAGQMGSAYPYSQLANWGASNLMQYGMGQMGTQNTLSNPQWWDRTQYTPQQVNQMGWT